MTILLRSVLTYHRNITEPPEIKQTVNSFCRTPYLQFFQYIFQVLQKLYTPVEVKNTIRSSTQTNIFNLSLFNLKIISLRSET